MKIISCFSTLFFCLINSISAQTEVGLVGIPSMSKFITGTGFVRNYFHPTFSYGARVNFGLSDHFNISTGLLHLHQGSHYKLGLTTVENPETIHGTVDVPYHAKALIIPVNVGYSIVSFSRSHLYADLGLYIGYLYEEYQDNSSYKETIEVANGERYPANFLQEEDHNLFSDLYLGVNAGIGWEQYFGENFSAQLRPNILFQIREDLPQDRYAWTNRFLSISMEMGVYYTLSK